MLVQTVLACLIAYLLGCVSTGYYLVRWRRGVDIRGVGSGTTGAFNVARLLQGPGFVLTLRGDLLKGGLALMLAKWLGLDRFAQMLAMLAVVLGHDFPLQLGFRGGNGLATATGALVVLDPRLTLALAVWFSISLPVLALLKTWFKVPIRYYTPSKVTVLATPLMALVLGRQGWFVVGLVVMVSVIMWTIRSNLLRLANLPNANG
jgi:glycerol-3-phosphate acyltransferase PlsY